MTKFIKTAELHLKEPDKEQKEKIQKAMEQSLESANKASVRMPSIPKQYIKHPQNKGSPIYGIVQDLRNNGITLNAQCTQEAVEKARESYQSQVMNGNLDKPPKFKNKFIALHNQKIKTYKENEDYHVDLGLFPYEKITLTFKKGNYQKYFLKRITEEDLDYGKGEIKKYNHGHSLNLSIKKEVNLDYEPETYIGIDLGLNMLAWAVALDSEGQFLDETHFKGSETGHIRRRYKNHRARLQKKGLKKEIKKQKNIEQRWMENKNHTISRRITEFTEQFNNPIIILENINVNQLRKRTNNPEIHSWTAGKLRDWIQYKAKEQGIKTKLINPRDTSRKCSKCGHTEEQNRKGINFKCQECGYKTHADFNAAKNIGDPK